MSVSAPSACACAATSASLRTLFPPKANGIESSRFTTRRGPPPSTADNRGRGSTGVERETNGSEGKAARAARRSADVNRNALYTRDASSRMDLLSTLRSGTSVFAAELRPPRAELAASEGMDAWIDTYHAVRRLTRQGTFVFLTDSAVGTEEEDNLRHLVTNLGHDVPRERIVPFLTSKHTLDYCFSYAERAQQHGFSALVVLGGDKSVGMPRCVGHAWQLRQLLRGRSHTIALGGWANPHADPERQVDFLVDAAFNAEFYLTQVVSHFDVDQVSRFSRAAERRGVE